MREYVQDFFIVYHHTMNHVVKQQRIVEMDMLTPLLAVDIEEFSANNIWNKLRCRRSSHQRGQPAQPGCPLLADYRRAAIYR